MLGSHSEDEFRSKLNKAVMEINYSPVPAPKPVKCFPVKHVFETIQVSICEIIIFHESNNMFSRKNL